MKKYKKWLLLFSIIGAFIPVLPCEAKYEETHEVELIDMGNGIWIPSSFDVVDENGNFATISNLSVSIFEKLGEQEIDDENYSIILDNGYRAVKKWTRTSVVSNTGYPRAEIYNENNELIFALGYNSGNFLFGMQDDDGNYVTNTYNDYYADYKNKKSEIEIHEGEDGTSIIPLARKTYNKDEDVCKNYSAMGDKLQLDSKVDYSAEGGPTVTEYQKVPSYFGEYDQDDEYYEDYSYKIDDCETYTAMQMVYVGVHQGPTYMPYNVTVPSKIIRDGEELHICWLEEYFEDTEFWSSDEITQESEKARDGRPIDMSFYFTLEQIEIIKAEGITSVGELERKHPDFFETNRGYVHYFEGEFKETEEERKEREAQEAIITNDISEESAEEVTYDGKWQTLSDGSKVFWQDLTGDIVPVNGMVPKYVMTQELQTPSGPRVTAVLYDENYSMIMHCMCFDTGHTNYKYVYLTRVDLALNMAEIMGTNESVSGNLNYGGETTYETENGEITGDIYDEYYYMPGEEY